MDLQTIARALGGEVRDGQVLAPGPGHSAKDRSLAVKPNTNAPRGVLVHSFAHDDPIVCLDYVAEKLQLPAFKPKTNGGGGHRRVNDDDAIEQALRSALAKQAAESFGKPKKAVAAYDYTDEHGTLLYQAIRLEPKDFRQRRPDGNGGWSWQLGDVRRVPYRWPELLQYPDATAFVCEGEKDADRVASLELCATTVAGGKWSVDCIRALAGRDVLILEDNDEAGRKKAIEAATALYGTAKTIRIVRLPDLPDKGDVSDWLDADPRRAEKLPYVCFDAPLWEPATAAAVDDGGKPEPADAKSEPSSPPAAPAPSPLTFIQVTAWHNQPVPQREWAVLNRIPLRNVTLLSGEGGVGKSILALHLGVAHVIGRDWLGTMPEPGSAIVLCCEDDENELHYRYSQIVDHYDVDFSDLKDLHPISLAGQDAVLAAPDRAGIIQPTKLFGRVREAACDIKPKLLVIDNSADVFAGNENDRAQVRQFITLLRGLAIDADTGLLLTSHPSLTGISNGSGLSGSTAWNASVRSRMYFRRATTDKDEEPDPDMRVLEVMKANYGPVGETITLRWRNGLFLPLAAMGTIDKMATEQAADCLFLKLLDKFHGQGRNVSHHKTANSYAPAMFARDSDAKASGIRKAALVEAMDRLFAANKIKVENYGRPSHPHTKLVRCH